MSSDRAEDAGRLCHEIEPSTSRGNTTLGHPERRQAGAVGGQSVALVAPSGSGKSTLLHIAGLLETPDDGEVYVDGHADLAIVGY